MKEITGPIFKFLGISEQTQQSIGNSVSKVTDAAVAPLDAAYSTAISAAETKIEGQLAELEKKTATCRTTLDTVNQFFEMLVAMPEYIKILLAPFFQPFLHRETAKALLADVLCCLAGTVGKPGSWCPKK